MTHGSLFSGIGGFDLASDWMGWDNKFHCEWNEFGKQILNYYWPQAKSYGDITTTDFTIWNGRIDILTGGFPCQPYSQAGKRRGKEDERHLWPEMLRAIKEIEPRWIVGENVYGIVNWNGGMVFEEVQAELEDEGYTVQPYVLPAAGVNAPHQRYRVWFVAYSAGFGSRGLRNESSEEGTRYSNELSGKQCGISGEKRSSSDSNKHRLQRGACSRYSTSREWEGCKKEQFTGLGERSWQRSWQNFPTQSPICNGDDGFSSELDEITFSKWRNESIKGGGNAIVPQVAFQIFKAIEKYDSKNRSRTR